jgi:putative ABC transport system permease protein
MPKPSWSEDKNWSEDKKRIPLMLKNYFLVALRSLRRQKAFAVINVLGLAVGMAGFTLFALMGGSKLQADRFHDRADELYLLIQVRTDESRKEEHTTYVPGPLAGALQSEFPEIRDVTRILPAGRVVFARGEDSFYENSVLFADPLFFSARARPHRQALGRAQKKEGE